MASQLTQAVGAIERLSSAIKYARLTSIFTEQVLNEESERNKAPINLLGYLETSEVQQLVESTYNMPVESYVGVHNCIEGLVQRNKELEIEKNRLFAQMVENTTKLQNKAARLKELTSNLVAIQQRFSSLEDAVEKTKHVWTACQENISREHPGKKPDQKKAAQKWVKRLEAFQKIAPQLREAEAKALAAFETAKQSLAETHSRLEWAVQKVAKESIECRKIQESQGPLDREWRQNEEQRAALEQEFNEVIRPYLASTDKRELLEKELRDFFDGKLVRMREKV